MSGEKRKKGQGKRLNDAERLEIIRVIESPSAPSLRQIARDFGVNEKTIRDLKKKKEAIKARTANSSERVLRETRRATTSKFPELEQCLFGWLAAEKKAGAVVLPCMLQRKALKIAQMMGIDEEKFKASNGWLEKFKQRWGVGSNLIQVGKMKVAKTNVNILEQPSKDNVSIEETNTRIQDVDESIDLNVTLQNLELVRQALHSRTKGQPDDELLQCLDTCAKLERQIQLMASNENAKQQHEDQVSIAL